MTRISQHLSRVLVWVLVLTMLVGLVPVSAFAVEDNQTRATETRYIGFTSDVHDEFTYLQSWMTSVKSKVPLEYMVFGGDYTYEADPAYGGVGTAAAGAAAFNQVVSLVNSAFGDTYSGIYTTGNHEYDNNYVTQIQNSRGFKRIGLAAQHTPYEIYCFGAYDDDSNGYFPTSDISALQTYLNGVRDDVPIFIVSHYPLHAWKSSTMDRETTNAGQVIDLLNQHPNVIFFWGHNHSQGDTNYGKIMKAGESITYNKSGSKKTLNFTYASIGCMCGSRQPYFGVVAGVNNGGESVSLTYYNVNGNTAGTTTTIQIVDCIHDWSDPVYTWTNITQCAATRTCKNNSAHTEVATAARISSKVTTPAGCESKGVTTYTAVFNESWAQNQTKELENINALNHSWKEPTYEWSADYTKCTAVRECSNDPAHPMTEVVNTTSAVTKEAVCGNKGTTTYTADFTAQWAQDQTKAIDNIPAPGEHEFEDGVCKTCGQPAWKPGDLNRDEIVDNADVAYLLWHTLFEDLYPIEGDEGDINEDGQVDNNDVAYLLWHTLFEDLYPLPPVANPTATLSGIAVTKNPTKLVYTAGESFDATGMEITATFSDNTTSVVTDVQITGGENLAVGTQTITISYTVGGVTKTATLTVTVNEAAAAELSGIAITKNPTKTTYTEGDNFDATGMQVTATYSNGTSKVITDYEVIGGKTLPNGTKSVTISYTEGEITKTATVSITVNKANRNYNSLNVVVYPYIPDVPAFKATLTEKWAKLVPDVKLNFVEWDCYQEPTFPSTADVVMYDSFFTTRYAMNNNIRAISPDVVEDTDDILAFTMDGATYNNKLYGIPFLACSNFLFYREGDTEIANAKSMNELCSVISKRYSSNKNNGLYSDYDTMIPYFYLDAVMDLNGQYNMFDTAPNLNSPDQNAIAVLRNMYDVQAPDPTGYDSFYIKGEAFDDGKGSALIAYSEAASVMKNKDDLVISSISFSDTQNIQIYYADIVSMTSRVTDAQKQKDCLMLMNLVASADFLEEVCFASEDPQYLLPTRISLYDVAAEQDPLYEQLRELVLDENNRVSRFGNSIYTYLDEGYGKLINAVKAYTPSSVTLSSIAITKQPTKTTYTEGENFSSTGMTVTATYSNGTKKAVTGYRVTGGENLAPGTQTITVTYTEGGISKTATVTVTVNAKVVNLSSIAVTKQPTKTTYTEGDNFDAAGMEITATYSDGTKKTVTGYTVSGGQNLTAGTKTITVSYTEKGITKTTTLTVNVNEVNRNYDTLDVVVYPYIPDVPAFKATLTEMWEELVPDVELNYVEWDCYMEPNFPDADIVMYDSFFTTRYIANNNILPISLDSVEGKEDILKFAMDGAVYNDKYYGIPFLACSNFMFYRDGDTEVANANSINKLSAAISDRYSANKNDGLLSDFAGMIPYFYLDALQDLNGQYMMFDAAPDLDNPDEEAIAVLRTMYDMQVPDPTGYESGYPKAEAFDDDIGSALIGYSESASVMDNKDDLVISTFSFDDNQNIQMFYADIISMTSRVTDTQKQKDCLKLMNLVASAEFMQKVCFDSAEPQYLLPTRISLYDVAAEQDPLYEQLRELALDENNRVARFGTGIYDYLDAGYGKLLAAVEAYTPTTATLSSIAVTKQPTKTTYTAGENFDTAGMEITATYSNGTKKTVTGYTVSGGQNLTAGTKTITISYTEGGVTKTAKVTVTVNAKVVELSSIRVTKNPSKTTYTEGESFNASGMQVTATYSDNSTKVVTDYEVSGGNKMTAGSKTITISYTENGITKTTTLNVTVSKVNRNYTTLNVSIFPWVPDPDAFMDTLSDMWSELVPSVKLNFVDWDCYYDIPPTNSDVIMYDAMFTSYWANEGYLQTINASDVEDSDDILPFALEGAYHNGKLYGIPYLACSNFLIYREGDTELANVDSINDLNTVLAKRYKTNKNQGLLTDFEAGLPYFYLDALMDLSGKYDQFNTAPDAVNPNTNVMTILSNMYDVLAPDLPGYYSAYWRAETFNDGHGSALIGYSETIAYMDDIVDDIVVTALSFSDSQNIQIYYADIASITSRVTDAQKKKDCLLLLNLLASAEFQQAVYFDSAEPQYLLPSRKSLYDIAAQDDPVYKQLRTLVLDSNNKVCRFGTDVYDYLNEAGQNLLGWIKYS